MQVKHNTNTAVLRTHLKIIVDNNVKLAVVVAYE